MQYRLRTLFAMVTITAVDTLAWSHNWTTGVICVTATGSVIGMWLRYHRYKDNHVHGRRWFAAQLGSVEGGAVTGVALAWTAVTAHLFTDFDLSDFLVGGIFMSLAGAAYGGLVGTLVVLFAILAKGIINKLRKSNPG